MQRSRARYAAFALSGTTALACARPQSLRLYGREGLVLPASSEGGMNSAALSTDGASSSKALGRDGRE